MIDIEVYNREFILLDLPNKSHYERIYNEMIVHTQGDKPEMLLCKRRPNEAQEVYEYRLDIYEPITKSSINKSIDKLFRLFLGTNFSIKISDELKDYVHSNAFDGFDLMSFIQSKVLKRNIEDPNGYLVWLPTGEGLMDPTQKVDVKPKLILSSCIHFANDEVFTFKISNDDERDVFITLTKTGIYKHTQINKAKTADKKRFSVELKYAHNMGIIPAILLGGNFVYDKESKTGDGFYESFFNAFLPFANEAIRQYSDWQAVMVNTAYPHREILADNCDHPTCRSGYVLDDEGDTSFCKKCNGTGKIIQRSPYGVYLKTQKNAALSGGVVDNTPSINFISPDPAIIEYSENAWKNLLERAEDAIHSKFIDEAQSGAAKAIDREDQYSFITKICNNLFDNIIYKSLVIIERYRNVVNPIDPVVIKPSTFSVKDEADLINELSELKTKNAPAPFLIEAAKDLAKKRFNGNTKVSKMIDVLVIYDPLFHLTIDEKNKLVASGGITAVDVIKSTKAYPLLNKLINDGRVDVEVDSIDKIIEALDAAVAPFLPQQITAQDLFNEE